MFALKDQIDKAKKELKMKKDQILFATELFKRCGNIDEIYLGDTGGIQINGKRDDVVAVCKSISKEKNIKAHVWYADRSPESHKYVDVVHYDYLEGI